MFRPTLSVSVLFLAMTVSLAAQAQVTVKDAWVRATVPQQKATGAFMQLQSAQDAKLLSAQSPVAGVVEVHEMAMDGGVMKMRAVPSLALPAGKAKLGTARIFMTPPSMAISCTSTTPATGDWADSSLASCADWSCMKAPVAFCWGTVARTQASLTVTWAWAWLNRADIRTAKETTTRFMANSS